MQEAFNVLTRYDVAVDREHFDQVDNLRYTFVQLLGRALEAQIQLLGKWKEVRNGMDFFIFDNCDFGF